MLSQINTEFLVPKSTVFFTNSLLSYLNYNIIFLMWDIRSCLREFYSHLLLDWSFWSLDYFERYLILLATGSLRTSQYINILKMFWLSKLSVTLDCLWRLIICNAWLSVTFDLFNPFESVCRLIEKYWKG